MGPQGWDEVEEKRWCLGDEGKHIYKKPGKR